MFLKKLLLWFPGRSENGMGDPQVQLDLYFRINPARIRNGIVSRNISFTSTRLRQPTCRFLPSCYAMLCSACHLPLPARQ